MLEKGSVVLALMGRDKGGHFLVVDLNEKEVFLADGRRRTLEKLKRKSRVHVANTEKKIPIQEVTGNKKLKALLKSAVMDN